MSSAPSSSSHLLNVAVLMPSSLHKSGIEIPDSTHLSASMIWLSVNRDFLISAGSFRWKKFYFSALRIFGGITIRISSPKDSFEKTIADAYQHALHGLGPQI